MIPIEETAAAKTALIDAQDKHGNITMGVSKIQKALQCGYNHAANIMQRLEVQQFISEPDSHGLRRINTNLSR